MDVRYSRNSVTLKRISMNVLCLYAMAYPLTAYLFMDGSKIGTIIVQAFQILPILAVGYLWKFRRKTGSLKSYIDVWTISIVYFCGAAVYFALFYAKENPFIEIVYAARFLSWFWLAATFKRIDLGPAFLERLAKSFWIGAAIQCLLAVWGKVWGLQNGLASPYSNVEATTGSANVSGKTVVSFIVVWIALSLYWLIVKRGKRALYGAGVLGGVAVVLFSYNRASQLGLLVAYCVAVLACVRKRRFKAAAVLLGTLAVGGAFFISSYGNKFLTRWETVAFDEGSGRVEMIEIAARCVTSPPSTGVFWCGRGVYQMNEMMYEEIGSRIGMHNDLLDFMIVYGAVGFALCAWAMYSILNFRKLTPRFSIENYFVCSISVFAVLIGLCTGMFQATYLYYMLISAQCYFISQARLRANVMERERLMNEEAFWCEEGVELDDEVENDDRIDDTDYIDEQEKTYWARRGYWAPNYD